MMGVGARSVFENDRLADGFRKSSARPGAPSGRCSRPACRARPCGSAGSASLAPMRCPPMPTKTASAANQACCECHEFVAPCAPNGGRRLEAALWASSECTQAAAIIAAKLLNDLFALVINAEHAGVELSCEGIKIGERDRGVRRPCGSVMVHCLSCMSLAENISSTLWVPPSVCFFLDLARDTNVSSAENRRDIGFLEQIDAVGEQEAQRGLRERIRGPGYRACDRAPPSELAIRDKFQWGSAACTRTSPCRASANKSWPSERRPSGPIWTKSPTSVCMLIR